MRFTIARGNLVLALSAAACLCAALFATGAAADPAFVRTVGINFAKDTPGLPPATGGANQPTSIFSFFDIGSVLVQSSANGISTQPVVVTQPDSPYFTFAGLNADFGRVTRGIVRIEATVALSRFADARGLATTDTSNGDEVTSLVATSAGNIEEEFSHSVVGTYLPNEPFRVRMDIDMTSRTWSAAVDNELNGFADDPVASGLSFANPPSVIAGVGRFTPYLQLQDFGSGSASVAFDDLTVSVPDPLPDLLSAVSEVGPGGSLTNKVTVAEAFLAKTDLPRACTMLTAFITEAKAQSGKSIPVATATGLVSEGERIRTTLNC